MTRSILNGDFKTADAVIFGAPYERSASYGSGAAQGPEKIIEALETQIEFYDRTLEYTPIDKYTFAYREIRKIRDLAPEDMVIQLQKTFMEEKRFFVLLGGVHSITIAPLQALSKKEEASKITVVQIDAHLDMRPDDSDYNAVDPSSFAHSTVMYHANELGFNTLSIGVRAFSEEEKQYAEKHKLPYYEWGRADIKLPTVQDIIESIKTEKVYLTIDVDGFNPSEMPGTGTPVANGLSWSFGNELIRKIMQQKKVLAADIVEVAPQVNTSVTEYNAAQLTYDLLSLAVYKQ